MNSHQKKDHIEGRAVYLCTLQDAATVLGTYSDEISCNPLETYALQVGASNQVYQTDFLKLVILEETNADLLKSEKRA